MKLYIKRLSLGLALLFSLPAVAGNNFWDGVIRQMMKNSKNLKITAVKGTPKAISFRGVIDIPSSLVLNSYSGVIHASAAQLVIDNGLVCNYSPASSTIHFNRIYILKNCSNYSRAGDDIVVNSKVEVRLNYASNSNSSITASIKVNRRDQPQYGVDIPINGTEGQILMHNGEAWVAADVSELELPDLAGEPGPQGEQGAIGPQGPAGANGVTGAQGLKGDKGDKGEKGDQGLAGAAGAAGPQGPIGPTGAVGPTGAAGAVGPQGPAGLAGATGVTGAQGSKGDKGDQGVAGITGSQGPQGPKGDAGEMGLPGAPGATGAQGTKGDKGDKGDRGLSEIAYLRDQRAAGTHGGSCLANTWNVRPLNILGGDTGSISLENNRFTLQPGKYFIEIQAPAYMVGFHQAKLVVIDTGEDILYGSTMVSHPTNPSVTHSVINGEIIVAITSTFEIRHRCSNEKVGVGLGSGTAFGTPEVYTQVKVMKKQ